MPRFSFTAACAAATLAAAPLAAQSTAAPSSITSRLFLGLGVNGSAIQYDGEASADQGGGISFQLGWGFTPRFALFTDLSGANVRSDAEYGLGHVDLGARYSFAHPAARWVPFLEGGVSARALVENDAQLYDDLGNPYTADYALSGTGITVGGGIQYYMAPKWALSAGLKWTGGKFTDAQIDDVTYADAADIKASSTRLNLGITWHPMAGR